jgi:hypothetical protein
MGSLFKILLVAILLTWAETKGQSEVNNHQAPNRCGQEECEKFQGCLETLETNLHGDVNTLVSKQADQFYLHNRNRYTYDLYVLFYLKKIIIMRNALFYLFLQNAKSINAESKFSLTSRSNSLILDWEDNSGCASQLTALNLKIFSVI